MELLGCGVAGLSYCGCGVKVGGALRLCSFALLGFFTVGCLGFDFGCLVYALLGDLV